MSGTDHKKRLVAILAADAAGYSRLMAADEAATVATLDAARAVFRTQIESNQGRVIDMAGDSVLAVFEIAAGAVAAALAVQRELDTTLGAVPEDRRMRFRIGVHMGDVIEKADGTIYGDGVNIAARLEGLAEPGGITISESIRTAVKGKVNASFEDRGERTVKNIAEPVRAYRVKSAGGGETKPTANVGEIDLSLPDKPSIAVLPFTNMSGDSEQEYFTDGVTEDIITELSRFKSLFVIARNSTFTYKGRAVDVRTVARELGVRYVLEGSIRKAVKRIRVTAQLVDSLTGKHLWAEKYDRVVEDIFEVQEEVTHAIVTAIAPQIDSAERERTQRRRPESLSAYEIAVRAYANALESNVKFDRSLSDQAIRGAQEALAIDARSTLALNALARAYWQHILLYTMPDREAAFQSGLAAANKSIEIDPSNHDAHIWKAWLLHYGPPKPHWDEALRSARLALELNPNSVLAFNTRGQLEVYNGNYSKGIELLSFALRLSPRDPMICFVYFGLTVAACLAGEYSQGVEFARQGTIAAPHYGPLQGILAMNYVGLGDIDSAKGVYHHAQQLSPGWVEPRLLGNWKFRVLKDVERGTKLLRIAAGLDSPEDADGMTERQCQ